MFALFAAESCSRMKEQIIFWHYSYTFTVFARNRGFHLLPISHPSLAPAGGRTQIKLELLSPYFCVSCAVDSGRTGIATYSKVGSSDFAGLLYRMKVF